MMARPCRTRWHGALTALWLVLACPAAWGGPITDLETGGVRVELADTLTTDVPPALAERARRAAEAPSPGKTRALIRAAAPSGPARAVATARYLMHLLPGRAERIRATARREVPAAGTWLGGDGGAGAADRGPDEPPARAETTGGVGAALGSLVSALPGTGGGTGGGAGGAGGASAGVLSSPSLSVNVPRRRVASPTRP